MVKSQAALKMENLPDLNVFAQCILQAVDAPSAKSCIDPMLQTFCHHLDVDLHPAMFVDEHYTDTEYGKAVSTITAAQCAEDYERGRVFIQGVCQAVQDQLASKDKAPVRLLYAGTGPFGWLVLPLLALFTAEQLQVTAIDIHEQSLERFRKLCEDYGVADRIAAWVCADACCWKAESPPVFDIILSETMKYLLQQEPQVRIFSWLQQYLAPAGVLIPESVILGLTLLWKEESSQQIYLGEAFTLNCHSAREIANGNEQILSRSFSLPDFEPGPVDLKLSTHIQVYRNHRLAEYQSQLTLPQFKNRLMIKPGSILTSRYQMGSYPDLVIDYCEHVIPLSESSDLSAGGIFHLHRLWQKTRNQHLVQASLPEDEWWLDRAVLDLCGIGLEPGMQMLYQSNRLSDLVRAVDQLKLTDDDKIHINETLIKLIEGNPHEIPEVLSKEQLAFWQANGYLVVPGVLSAEQCENSRQVIWEYLQADPEVANSWYQSPERMQKIMLQLFRHPVLDENRRTPLIRNIFEQLWQRTDLAMSTDRVSFNPPETASWQFPGPDMHWDMPLQAPVSFGTQGLIYLTDTSKEQGAFCCVPGFHLEIDAWLQQQNKPDVELQKQNWSEWLIKPISGKAGDLIIWHHALPHGASRNKAASPRMVQYINMYPLANGDSAY
ncbi:phytanoyl-CoA dioxygenase family protein [Cellvibrio polysaccharolyticus]|uniref:Methyltransferase domain-containing protein n=1 Tax=Cellvibrio polysaccharolyticus TaxID=2082724 RepID=A0A928V0B5_9GAMM|nr:phytanoyl-CoA dioxygenase family protein [Cellvibrio polysaccharolyticus]MBE8716378.1 methyltransferase domain-containing protein [Cellvibrio polysaccharolyticus]